MSVVRHRVHGGAYYDSIVLMQLQASLAAEPGVRDCAAVMATSANRSILEAGGLLPEDLGVTAAEDLLLVVAADDEQAAQGALATAEQQLAQRQEGRAAEDELPPPASLRQALRRLPDATWAAISVPGRWAARVARQALARDLDVYLYSDNVSEADEVALKRSAAERGRLVLGPDCGTAILDGVRFGFANRVRRGRIGLIGASGTGLQAVTGRIHALGAGVSHAIGVGGRDLQTAIGADATLRALAALAADARTAAIAIVSKPPSADMVRRLVAACLGVPKPVVLALLGTAPPIARMANLIFASGLASAAEAAVAAARRPLPRAARGRTRGSLRALFAGGTLALETLAQLRFFLPLTSNLSFADVAELEDPATSRGHTVIDMGEDRLTVGRLHPMIDPELRLRRLAQEAADPEVSTLLLDVVLGDGAEADPAARLAPAIESAMAAREDLAVLVVVLGTELDPQGRDRQVTRLEAAGARVFARLGDALDSAVRRLVPVSPMPSVEPLRPPVILNIGLETFYAGFRDQGVPSLHVAWRPPASGNARLVALLDAMESA